MKLTFSKILFFSFFYLVVAKLLAQGTDYVSFPMMNLEIKHTLQENDRQKIMRNRQVAIAYTETQNESKWSHFKNIKVKIQNRLRTVSFALQAIPTGAVMYSCSQKIANYQEQIINELTDAPELIVSVFQDEIQFADDLQMITRLVIGIVVSYGALNQMEKAERKVFLDYALEEIKSLEIRSFSMLMKIREVKMKLRIQQAAFQNYINRDKEIVEEFLENINNL